MNDSCARSQRPPFAPAILAFSLMVSFQALAAPVGGVVAAGTAAISGTGAQTTITQSSASAVINWQGFGIAAGEAVRFAQPGSSSVTLNRVVGADPSAILGSLSANGRVFLVNPAGVLFGPGASVNVGGLVASTLNISDADFMAGRHAFTGSSRAAVVNQGTINADGGSVALLGAQVSNQGSISARLGSIALAAGEAIRLDVLGDNLLHVTVERATVDALVRNGGLLQADGGQVVLTAQAAGSMLSGAVNNTGVIQAQTIGNRNGTILLMGNMADGTVDVAGTLDASAPNGGNGGFIETSAARVRVHDGAKVTTAAPFGRTGEWLIDPEDFTIGSAAGDNISGATLSALLVTNSVVITTAPGPDATTAGAPPVTRLNTATNGNGDIFVNDAVSWTAAPDTTTLTLNASRDVNINRAVTAVNGNFVVCCGRDVNVNAAISTTNGSVLLSAGRNIGLGAAAAMTTTDGNMMMCAANDLNIGSALVLTRGSSIPSQSLGLPTGMVLSAGTGGTGPGTGGGTLTFAPLAPPAAVTGPNADVRIDYNPPSYAAPTDFSGRFTLTNGATLTQRMLVFGVSAAKTFDGSTATTLTGLEGNPAGVTLVAGPGSIANFDTAAPGIDKPITFSGYTLAGPAASQFALPVSCCGPAVARTTGTLLAAALPPVVVPPAIVPPVPVVIVPPPVVVPAPVLVAPGIEAAPGGAAVVGPGVTGPAAIAPAEGGLDLVMPQFVPFAVAPLLLQAPRPLLVAPAVGPAPMELVLVQAPAPAAQAAPPALPAAPAAALPAPAAPARAPLRAPKAYRN